MHCIISRYITHGHVLHNRPITDRRNTLITNRALPGYKLWFAFMFAHETAHIFFTAYSIIFSIIYVCSQRTQNVIMVTSLYVKLLAGYGSFDCGFSLRLLYMRTRRIQWHRSMYDMHLCFNISVKTKIWNDGIFVIIGDTVGCRYDNLRCRQWPQSWHHDIATTSYTHKNNHCIRIRKSASVYLAFASWQG